jgi:hypothetical protein
MYDFTQLYRLGISREDAVALRRISMTLHRWHELECGDGNEYASWGIERDEKTDRPYLVTHPYNSNKSRRTPIVDKENGAKRRLGRIMERYPTLQAYVQGDPRGAALYILYPGNVPEGADPNAYYSRGVAVYK